MDKTDVNKRKVIDALVETRGIVTDACKKSGVARSVFYEWLNADPNFKKEVEDVQEQAIDFVEGQLLQKIAGVKVTTADGDVFQKEPSDTAIIFYLKTKGKKRGYIERQEIEHDASDKFILQLGVKNEAR